MFKQFSLLFLLFFIILFGCNDKQTNYIEIDFSKPDTSTFHNTKNGIELSFAISAMYTPKETFVHYKELVTYISKKINIPIVFKLRKTYSEINELLETDELDFAFICTGAYQKIINSTHVEMLCIPIINNQPYYYAYIIVNNKHNYNTIEDLRNTTLAYTDPMSNTGYEYINNLLKSKGLTSKEFFKNTIFTNGHDNSIMAVSKNEADCASINSLIYDYYFKFDKNKIKDIRIIYKSPKFGMPLFVINTKIDTRTKEELKNILLNMNKDSIGEKIIEALMIDRFEIPDMNIYEETKISN